MKHIVFLFFLVALASCVESQRSVVGKSVDDLIGGISERAVLSSRKEHFSAMPTRALCELALVIESEVYETYNSVPLLPSLVAERSPFSFGETDPVDTVNLEEVTLFPHMISLQNKPYSNRSLAMQELSSRAEMERQKVCPVLAHMNGRDASRAGYDCVGTANQIPADVLCTGTYDNQPFSVALADIVVLRRQAETSAAERRRLQSKMAPLVRCTSSEVFGSVQTTCY